MKVNTLSAASKTSASWSGQDRCESVPGKSAVSEHAPTLMYICLVMVALRWLRPCRIHITGPRFKCCSRSCSCLRLRCRVIWGEIRIFFFLLILPLCLSTQFGRPASSRLLVFPPSCLRAFMPLCLRGTFAVSCHLFAVVVVRCASPLPLSSCAHFSSCVRETSSLGGGIIIMCWLVTWD